MAETSRRPFTQEERRQIESSLKSEQSWTTGLFDAFFAFGGSLLVFLLLLALFFRGYPRAVELGASAVSLVIGMYVYVRVQRGARRSRHALRLRDELARGEAEVLRYDVVDAIEVEELEDEGLNFYLKLEDGRVLFLSGQYLYEPVEERRFPNSQIEVVRTPTTGRLLDFNTLGRFLSPSSRRPPFRKAEYRGGSVPEDGAILAIDFESLRPGR